ncbi:MAG: NUDIX hydrolase [Chloroflexi bacterium]|nr:NUDIX hydrolase [Chloroflexota bacterium]
MHERTVTTRRQFEGRIINLRVDEVELDNGRRSTREIVEHPGAVAILAWDGARLAVVRQWRHPAAMVLLEIPAGTLEPGEPPLETARRELAEEVGLGADEWLEGPRFWTAPGFCTELMHVFLATALHDAHAEADTDEILEPAWMSLADAIAACDDGRIADAKSIAAIAWLARQLRREG